nr:MAG TPA: hypothetical protein [Caudoviricetes sp.]
MFCNRVYFPWLHDITRLRYSQGFYSSIEQYWRFA